MKKQPLADASTTDDGENTVGARAIEQTLRLQRKMITYHHNDKFTIQKQF